MGTRKQGPGSVDPRSPAGLPSRCPKSYNLQHFAIWQKFSSNLPGSFLDFFPWEAPEQTPETATAFSISRSETWVPKRGGLKPAGKRQENATFLQRSFFDVAVQFFVCCSAAFGPNDFRTAEKPMLQCSFCSAAFRKLQRNFRFRLWHVAGAGFRGVGFKELFRAFRVPHYNQGSYQNLTLVRLAYANAYNTHRLGDFGLPSLSFTVRFW